MINPYLPAPAKILSINNETADVKLYKLRFLDSKLQKNFYFQSGQFVLVGLAGLAEAPINICSRTKDSTKYFELAVRKVGRLTEAIHKLKKGELLYLRGPYGNGWPTVKNLAKKNLLLVGGGCGFIPLRAVTEDLIQNYAKKNKVQIFYGCSSQQDVLFKRNLPVWQKAGVSVKLIFDKQKPKTKTIKGVSCGFGLITKLFNQTEVVKDASAFICGPEVMFKFVIKKLKEKGFADQDIYLSLERRMTCGLGVCQHCAIGEKYVCLDGPVFRYDQIKNFPARGWSAFGGEF